MMNVEHERALLLRRYTPVEIPWRTHGLIARVVFFGLAAVGLFAFMQLLDLIGVPKPGIAAGLLALVIAELLIRRRWWWTGVEEALWLGGMFALISALPSSGSPESLLVIAAACAIPGLRVRNPLFGAAAAVLVVAWFEKRFDLGVIAALLLAFAAVLALLRTWRRPTTEWLWIALVLVLPIAGRFYADEVWRVVTITLYAAYGAATLLLAIRNRHHALFVSGAIAVAIAATDVADRIAMPLEAKLASAGTLLLVGSWLLARALRDRTTGIVTTPAKLTQFDDELEIAATVSIPEQNFDQRMESGGRFGGAGATGDY